MPSLFDPVLEKVYHQDKLSLENTQIPIITISASTREDTKGNFGFHEDESIRDVVFSRAHFSMALGVAVAAWGNKINPAKAWVSDPTNYVSDKQWNSITFTESIGKTLARRPFLKKLKDLVDKFGRSKLPILKSISPPLIYLTQDISRPLLSFHIAAGNMLSESGKSVVQMITDPHVRDEYLNNAHKKNFYLLVFDDKTKTDALEQGKLLGKSIDPDRIIVTGPPVDPRIVACKTHKKPYKSGKLRLAVTTGGLGTNKPEIAELLDHLLSFHTSPPEKQIIFYAGTHQDFFQMALDMSKKHRIKPLIIREINQKFSNTDFEQNKLIILYHPQITDANELLIKYAFPHAHGFISKPSGDMAYDVAASGSFLLTLAEWGEWEHHVREVFEQKMIARRAIVGDINKQLASLTDSSGKSQSFVELAMENALNIDPLFTSGAKNIVREYLKIANAISNSKS